MAAFPEMRGLDHLQGPLKPTRFTPRRDGRAVLELEATAAARDKGAAPPAMGLSRNAKSAAVIRGARARRGRSRQRQPPRAAPKLPAPPVR